MADSRAARSSSRRITPVPRPPPTAATAQTTRPSRRAGTRSVSRGVEDAAALNAKVPRRSTRQASVTSVASATSDHDAPSTRRSKRPARKEEIAELSMVEEAESQLILEAAAQSTPRRRTEEVVLPQPSPGAISEMSGTTAISSFSMVEAEMLEAKLIQKYLPRLYDSATDFLHHLAPEDGQIETDDRHVQEMQKPDSPYTAEYRDLDSILNIHLGKFRTEHQQYVRLRAVRRALLGPGSSQNPNEPIPGLDLVVYLANLLIFAKQMIASDRGEKEIWDALRELDRNQFPQIFLPAIAKNASASPTGESSLLEETFDLGLELRTQLAILVLESASNNADFDADECLKEVFLNGSSIRGWDISGLSGGEGELSSRHRAKVKDQVKKIRAVLPDIEALGAVFPWRSVVLQLLQWVRLRHKELQASIQGLGGITAVGEMLKNMVQKPDDAGQRGASQGTPRKVRRSFGRERRKSGRKFDPHDPSNDAGVFALLAREKRASLPTPAVPEKEKTPVPAEEPPQVEEELPQVDEEPPQVDDELPVVPDEQPPVREDELPPFLDSDLPPALDDDYEPQSEDEGATDSASLAAQPPKSTADFVKIVKEARKVDKENNRGSFFARQPNARRIEFGDGFDDSQPMPGPSHKGKEPQRSSPKKRHRSILDDDTDDDDDVFETDVRVVKAPERRKQAPVAERVRIEPSSASERRREEPTAKRARLDPYSSVPQRRREAPVADRVRPEAQSSGQERRREVPTARRVWPEPQSSAPPSHQPRTWSAGRDYTREQDDDRDFEADAPPQSTYQDAKKLARRARTTQQRSKQRVPWTAREEQAFVDYMAKHHGAYAAILEEDNRENGGPGLLEGRTQVDLKDKKRNMCMTLIKSGTGLLPGFEFPKHTKDAQNLLARGCRW